MTTIRSKIERMVAVINENKTVLDAVDLMTGKYIGAVVVIGNTGVRGVFTERDLMVKVVGQRREPATVKLRDVIPENILKVSPDESCSYCLELMKQNRCRHLLVFEGEEFVGIVSLRDLVALMLEEKEDLISQLEKYITG
jgi:CBS domain-containing protein